MIYKHTSLKIVDNSGAKFLKVFQLLKYPSSQKFSLSGDIVLGSIKKYKPNKKISKKQICTSLIITAKKNICRKGGNWIKFDESRGILITKDLTKLIGTRFYGPISKDVRRGLHSKLLSISNTIL